MNPVIGLPADSGLGLGEYAAVVQAVRSDHVPVLSSATVRPNGLHYLLPFRTPPLFVEVPFSDHVKFVTVPT